jgi:hypothetical protein
LPELVLTGDEPPGHAPKHVPRLLLVPALGNEPEQALKQTFNPPDVPAVWPAKQSVRQTPPVKVEPTGQTRHSSRPVPGFVASVPDGHDKHWPPLNVLPAGQLKHTGTPASVPAVVPAAQLEMHWLVPYAVVPAGQGVMHWVAPNATVPPGQVVMHCAVLVCTTDPAGQVDAH